MLGLRKLRQREHHPELLFLSLSATAAAVAWVWFRYSLPLPVCHLKYWTGLSCPTCGATRGLHRFLEGDWWQSFLYNPLVFFGLIALLLANLYAVLVLVGGLPKVRLNTLSKPAQRVLRVAVILAILSNWIYVTIR